MSGQAHDLTVMILVKATPVLTRALEESMCVAAMTLKREPKWVRLHPVPFRDLDEESKFKKYQELTVRVSRPRDDRRPESWIPHEGTLRLGSVIGTDHGWSARRERVAQLGERTMCELQAANASGHGPSVPSLAAVRTAEEPELLIDRRDDEQLKKWRERAAANVAQPSLFGSGAVRKAAMDVVPWRFRYRYRCLDTKCGGHAQTIIDWEAVALWRRVRQHDDWQQRMRRKFVDEIWASDRDTILFVGNQVRRPQGFLVLGIFWPPSQPIQQALLT